MTQQQDVFRVFLFPREVGCDKSNNVVERTLEIMKSISIDLIPEKLILVAADLGSLCLAIPEKVG